MSAFDRLRNETKPKAGSTEEDIDWGLSDEEDDDLGFDDFENRDDFSITEEEVFTSIEDRLDSDEEQAPFASEEGQDQIKGVIESNEDSGLSRLTAVGRDTQTGSVAMTSFFNNMITTQVAGKFQPQVIEEETPEGEVIFKITPTFDENEKARLETIILNTIKEQQDNKFQSKRSSYKKELDTIADNIHEIQVAIKRQTIELESEYKLYTSYKVFYDVINKDRNGESLTYDEVRIFESAEQVGIQQVVTLYNQSEKKYLASKLRLDNTRESLKKAFTIQIEFEEKMEADERKISENPILDKARKILTNMSKVTQVEFSTKLRDANFNEDIVALTCGCGQSDIYKFSQLPRFTSGDISNDFKARSKVNNGVKKNYFETSKAIKDSTTKYTLAKANSDIYMYNRLEIPGVTTEGEALMCSKCKSYMLFSPEVYDSMAERGHIQDIWLLEFSKSKEGQSFDLKSKVLITVSESVLGKVYSADLGLHEYKTQVISSKINKVDNKASSGISTRTSLLSREFLADYAKLNGLTMSPLQIETNLMNKASSLKNRLDMLIAKENSKANSKSGSDKVRDKALARATFLMTYRDFILEWAFHEDYTAEQLRIHVVRYLDSLTEFSDIISSKTVSKQLESIITGKPLILFQNGRLSSIDNNNKNLPHANFIACYYPLVYDYIMNIHKKIKTNSSELYNVSKIFYNIQSISRMNYKKALATSEELVVSLIRALGDKYYQERGPLFEKYSLTEQFEYNFSDDNYTSDWIYYEFISQQYMPRHAQPVDDHKFGYLYGKRLSNDGVTDMYDLTAHNN